MSSVLSEIKKKVLVLLPLMNSTAETFIPFVLQFSGKVQVTSGWNEIEAFVFGTLVDGVGR
jgi:hypothetical protein